MTNENFTLEEALRQIFQTKDLTPEIKNRLIEILTKKETEQKSYTMEEALMQIFQLRHLPPKLNTYKSRYLSGKIMTHETKMEILTEFGFHLQEPAKYARKFPIEYYQDKLKRKRL